MWITNARRRELNSFSSFSGVLGALMSWLSLNDYLVGYLSIYGGDDDDDDDGMMVR